MVVLWKYWKVSWVAQVDEGGTIDPSCFVDEDGSRVLIYKNDGNSMGKECWLYMRRLEADGVTLVGDEVSPAP